MCQYSAPTGLALRSSSKGLLNRVFIARPSLERSRRAEYDSSTTFAKLVPDGWQCPVSAIVGRLRVAATKLAN
jgi:hypothetical protein